MNTAVVELIYDIVAHIPKGRVTSYGAIAKCVGAGGSARLVGWTMNKAASRPGLPAHRVVNSKGILTGKNHFGSPTLMQELLEKEGIAVKNDQVQDFDHVFWDPIGLLDDGGN